MNSTFCRFWLVLTVLLGVCCRSRQTPEALITAKEPAEMIHIQNLSLTDKDLIIDYRATNIFEDSIWVCHDTSVYGKQDVQNVATRINDETVWIKMCFNLGSSRVFVNPPAIAKYVRLLPGESCSGRIVQDLPVRDYKREWRAENKEHKEIVLHRIVFELGYIGSFGPKWNALLDSWAEKMKNGSIESKPRADGPYYHLPVNPLITEETLDGQLREVMYLRQHTSIEEKEKSAEVLVVDVNIPCSIVIEGKDAGSALIK
jgi:hypothetical protein